MDLFKKNVLLLERFARVHGLTFNHETASQWPSVEYANEFDHTYELTVRHEGRVTFSWCQSFDSDDVKMFECFVDPTENECILFELEKGRRYILDYRNTFRKLKDH